MSRWFRHYAGMARDDKLVRASIKSKQTIERVVWVWSAILESAAEIDDGGRYEIDHAEMARFLRCTEGKLAAIEDALRDLGRVSEGAVAKWSGRQFQSDKSAVRTKRYRDNLKGKNSDGEEALRDDRVTSQERHGDAPETETETETEVPLVRTNGAANDLEKAVPDPDKVFWDSAKSYLGKSKAPLIGKWVSEHGKRATIAAITFAQSERAVDPVQFIQGHFRHLKAYDGAEMTMPC